MIGINILTRETQMRSPNEDRDRLELGIHEKEPLEPSEGTPDLIRADPSPASPSDPREAE